MPSPRKPRITQFWMFSAPRLKNRIPLAPAPPPDQGQLRRLTTSLAPTVTVIASVLEVTVTPASPTPSLMMLTNLLIVTAP
jgi:hypothetical protein